MPDHLTRLEREVMTTLLAPDHPVMDALRRQFEFCRVTSREFTGVGFFSKLAVADGAAPAPVTRKTIALLETLEGFSFDEPWPDDVTRFRITAGGVAHHGGSETDREQIEAAWDRGG